MNDKIEKAEDKLSTAKLLIENEKYEDAVSRAYHAMFHAAKALLESKDSSPKTHQGINSELGKLFREEIDKELLRDFSNIQQLREDADYGVSSDFTKEKVQEVIESAENFLSAAKNYLHQ